jgi:flagellar biosynthesis protein FliR
MGLPDTTSLMYGTLAFVRICSLLIALPVFGDQPTPLRVRILLALGITVGVFPTLPIDWAPNLDVDVFLLAAYIIKEAIIGLFLGYMARAAFTGLLMASGLTAYQMGFGTSSLFLADAGSQMDSFTAFHRIICMLLFLTLNLHYVFLSGISDSFALIPGGQANFHGDLGEVLITITAGIFSIAMKISAPIIVSLLFTMAALGLVARTVPQMNVFTLSFPASFFLGLGVYVATMPLFPQWMQDHYLGYESAINSVLSVMAQ